MRSHAETSNPFQKFCILNCVQWVTLIEKAKRNEQKTAQNAVFGQSTKNRVSH